MTIPHCEYTYSRAYDILVELAQARESGREDFIRYHVTKQNPGSHSEWRFQGDIGFGAKFYVEGIRGFRVGCYTEERTPKVNAQIDEINKRLSALWKLSNELEDFRQG